MVEVAAYYVEVSTWSAMLSAHLNNWQKKLCRIEHYSPNSSKFFTAKGFLLYGISNTLKEIESYIGF